MKTLFLVLSFCIICFTSCLQEKEAVLDDASDLQNSFSVKSIEIFDEVSTFYPKEDVRMTLITQEDGIEVAEYSLIGKSYLKTNLGTRVSASEATEEGTTCSGAYGCGTALKKCLDEGFKGVITNGACASYCVTCQ
jgi:hypothetical protein